MNLLKDVPITAIYTKIQNKKASSGDTRCDITYFSLADILDMVGDGNCLYTGQGFKDLKDVTFERINPKQGYVRGNVVMVSLDANRHKSRLDQFMHETTIPDAMKVKLLRKAIYQLEKGMK